MGPTHTSVVCSIFATFATNIVCFESKCHVMGLIAIISVVIDEIGWFKNVGTK